MTSHKAVMGCSVHSGWAASVAVSGTPERPEIVDRRRIALADPAVAGAKQPYHYAENRNLADAERHLAGCQASASELAGKTIRQMTDELRNRGYSVDACAILLAAGRPLPPLANILASHALIHTAEGEHFRTAIRDACEKLGLGVRGIRARDLEELTTAPRRERILNLGKALGPPWTQDQKLAALAASVVLWEAVEIRTEAGNPLR